MVKRRIGILTGGGDVPGLNGVIKSFVARVQEHGHEAVGLRRGWEALVRIVPDASVDNSEWMLRLDRASTRTIERPGGTVLHTTRLNPEIAKLGQIPDHLLGEIQAGEP